MKYPYYPGCTLHEQAAVFNESAIRVARELEMELVELEDWQCCGAVYPLATDSLFPMASPLRNLVRAGEMGDQMVTSCAACYNVHKRVAHLVEEDSEILERINSYNREDEYQGGVEVLHLLEIFCQQEALTRIEEMTTRELGELRVGAYYGCLLLRPAEVLAFDDPEAPTIFENLLSSLGCDVIEYPYRTECCGAYATVHLEEPPRAPVQNIIESALRAGAEMLVVSCPLCHYNLVEGQELLKKEEPSFDGLQVLYFTELMEYAFGLRENLLEAEPTQV